jgi:hypothetical protein
MTYTKYFLNNLIVITLCLYVIVYIALNYELLKEGKINYNITKPLMATALIIIICYIYATWNEDDEIEHYLTKEPIKYKIVNPDNEFIDAINNNDIFVPQNKRSKFGINF